jgi:hypothetical protein
MHRATHRASNSNLVHAAFVHTSDRATSSSEPPRLARVTPRLVVVLRLARRGRRGSALAVALAALCGVGEPACLDGEVPELECAALLQAERVLDLRTTQAGCEQSRLVQG